MNGKTKGGLFVVSLLGLIQLAWFIALIYPLPVVSHQINQWQTAYPWSQWPGLALGIISGLIFLGVIIRVIAGWRNSKQLTYRSKQGKLKLDRRAVEKNLQRTLATQYGISNVDAKIQWKKHGKTAAATITAQTDTPEQRQQLSEQIAATTTQQLSSSLGVPIKKVGVNLKLTKQSKRQQTRVV